MKLVLDMLFKLPGPEVVKTLPISNWPSPWSVGSSESFLEMFAAWRAGGLKCWTGCVLVSFWKHVGGLRGWMGLVFLGWRILGSFWKRPLLSKMVQPAPRVNHLPSPSASSSSWFSWSLHWTSCRPESGGASPQSGSTCTPSWIFVYSPIPIDVHGFALMFMVFH